jgi:hypothetical protein
MSRFPGYFRLLCQTVRQHLGASAFCAIEARDGDERFEQSGRQKRGK